MVIQSKSPSIIEALDVEYEDVSKNIDRVHEMYELKKEFHQAKQKLITAKTDYMENLLKRNASKNVSTFETLPSTKNFTSSFNSFKLPFLHKSWLEKYTNQAKNDTKR